ncbi:GHKL domain-containing protein, partial [Candidatus Pacearchaeota archaeon]|nr:GHKL domain-containing protein [Candidatus Pacearchaeota archaeon]
MDKEIYYSKLQSFLTIAFLVVIIIPTLTITSITTHNFKKYAIKKISINESRIIEHRADVIGLFLKQQEHLLSTLAGIYSIDYLSKQENLDSLFIAVNSSGDIVDLQVIDSSGEQLAYVGPYRSNIAGKSYNKSPWFQEVLISGRHISDVFLGYRNKPHFVVAVTDPLKLFVFRATINSELFDSLLRSAQIGLSGDAFIINRNAEFQTSSLQGKKTVTLEEKKFLEYHEGTAAYVSGSNIYATRWINDGQWLLIIKSKIEDSLGPFYENRNLNFIIISITSILALSFAYMASLYMVSKIRKTDQERANIDHQMVQVEKMATIGRLAAGIAHEINNPLQMITTQSGWIEELLPEEDPNCIKNLEEYTEAIKKIRYHVRRAGNVTHRLLGFSRKISAEKECVNINEIIEETVSFVENEAKNNNIVINRNLNKAIPKTMTDGPHLQQVFLNLFNNALDAVEQNGSIDITTRVDKKIIFVEIADSGPGIDPKIMNQIFDPFFTTKDPGKGTGLGMSICYDIMKKLGGAIRVKNRKEGGAIFTLAIPIRDRGQSSEVN